MIEGAPRSRCCKSAYAAGLLYDLREMRENCLVLVLSAAAARRECARVFREQYRRTALLNGSVLMFPSEELYADYQKPPVFACPHCGGHFLRGLMISNGSISDPMKSYHLEFRLANEEKVPFLAQYLEDMGWKAGARALQGGGVGVYIKNSTVIEEILSVTACNNALFALMNAKISRNIRNDANRTANCETHNIQRAVSASARCRAAIELLQSEDRLDVLPDELRETALLRLEFPDASLAELAHRHNPPITKSGLNHRLQKIMAEAERAPRGEQEA